MPLSLVRAAANVVAAFGSAFVVEPGTPDTYVDLGIVRGLSIKTEPLATDADTYGRPHQIASRFIVEGTLMQTADAELGEDGDLATGEKIIKLTTEGVAAAGAEAAAGYVFNNALLQMGTEINLGGEQSFRTFRLEGVVSREELNQFGVSQEITFGQ